MKGFYGLLSKIIATVFFIGYIPFAHGTFGSLAGLLLVWFFKPNLTLQIIILAACFAAGVLSSGAFEKDSGEKDNKRIVIDEFAGYFASIILLPLTSGYLLASFFLFRFLDILKPFPIKQIERRLSGGMGIMMDDIAAGLMTNLALQIWRIL